MNSSTVSGAPSPTLRLAIFVPAGPVPSWVVRLVDDCADLPDVALVALMRDEGVRPGPEADDSPGRRVTLAVAPGVAEWSGADAGEAARWLAGRAPEVLLDLRPEPAPLPEGPARHWTLAQTNRPEAEDDAAIALVTVPDGAPVEGARDTLYAASTQANPRRDIARGMGMVRRALLHLAQAPRGAGGARDA